MGVWLVTLKRMPLMLAAFVLLMLFPIGAIAQDAPTPESVIALVIDSVPEIAAGLDTLTDYQTYAYNSNNSYGIWQVEFEDYNGSTIAWAQVRPRTGRIYAWDAYFNATEDAYEAVLPVFREFVANDPSVRELIRGIEADDLWPWWDGGEQAWVVWIGDAGDAIMVAVEFEGGSQDSTENPSLKGIWFPNLPSYDEWWVASSSQAVALAFQEIDIAAALRDTQWTTDSRLTDDSDTNIWTVNFLSSGSIIATATVNVLDGDVLSYEVME